MFACVAGEGLYGICTYKTGYENFGWGSPENRQRSYERKCKKVRCLNDNIEFKSIKETSKYYGIPEAKISASAKENKDIIRNNDKSTFKFVFI